MLKIVVQEMIQVFVQSIHLISWKLIWQIIFILSIVMFIFMFIKFTYSGYKDIKELLKDNDEK